MRTWIRTRSFKRSFVFYLFCCLFGCCSCSVTTKMLHFRCIGNKIIFLFALFLSNCNRKFVRNFCNFCQEILAKIRGRLFERRLAKRWISQTLPHVLWITEPTSCALNIYFREKLNYSHWNILVQLFNEQIILFSILDLSTV